MALLALVPKFDHQMAPIALVTNFTILKFFGFGTSLEKKRYFVEKSPILGEGGGLPTWEFFPHNTVFF